VTDVAYFAGWLDEPGLEAPSGDTIEEARRRAAVIEARQEREAQREADERRQVWEDLAEHRLRDAPTLAEVLEKTERRQRAEDYRNERAEAREREERLAHAETAPDDLRDLEREHRRKLRDKANAEGPPAPGSARDIAEKSGRVPVHRTPEAPPSPFVRQTPKALAEAPKARTEVS
jgi:hypothetical protein